MSDRIKDRILELEKRLSEKPEQAEKDADYYYIQGELKGLNFALGYEITRTVQETADQLKYKKRQVYYRTTKGDFGNYYHITEKKAEVIEQVKNTNKGGKLLIPQTGIDNFLKKHEVKVAKAGDSNQKNLYVHRQDKKNLVKVEKEEEA